MSQAASTDRVSDRLNPTAQPFHSTKSQETVEVPVSRTDGVLPTALVWKNFEITQWESYIKLQHRNRRGSNIRNPKPYPSTFKHYISNRIGVLNDETQNLKAAIAAKEHKIEMRRRNPVKIMPAFGGKNFERAAMVVIQAIPPVTEAEIWAKRRLNGEMDLDPVFTEMAEYRVGRGLLEML